MQKFSNKVNPLNLVLPENTLQNTSDWMNSSVEKTLDYIQTNTQDVIDTVSQGIKIVADAAEVEAKIEIYS